MELLRSRRPSQKPDEDVARFSSAQGWGKGLQDSDGVGSFPSGPGPIRSASETSRLISKKCSIFVAEGIDQIFPSNGPPKGIYYVQTELGRRHPCPPKHETQ